MTLGELRQELLKLGIRQVASAKFPPPQGHPPTVSLMFSADTKVVFPFPLQTQYYLALDSDDDNTPVHSEKYAALMRAIERDRLLGLLGEH